MSSSSSSDLPKDPDKAASNMLLCFTDFVADEFALEKVVGYMTDRCLSITLILVLALLLLGLPLFCCSEEESLLRPFRGRASLSGDNISSQNESLVDCFLYESAGKSYECRKGF